MKKILFVILSLMLASLAYSTEYKAFEGKKLTSSHGMVGLYETEGKMYLEVPCSLLGKRLLTGTMVEQCSDMLESNVGYQPVTPYVIGMERLQNKLLMYRLNETYVPVQQSLSKQ